MIKSGSNDEESSIVVMKVIGPLLVVGLYILSVLVYYSLMFDVLLTIHLSLDMPMVTICLLLISCWIMFNLVFNYTLVVFTPPGNTHHFSNKYSLH